jgi:hypothetical protein
MPHRAHAPSPAPLSEQERGVFLRHMGFRFLVVGWAIYSLASDSFSRALYTLIVVLCIYSMGEVVFSSLLGQAHRRARQDKERRRREEETERQRARQAAKAE